MHRLGLGVRVVDQPVDLLVVTGHRALDEGKGLRRVHLGPLDVGEGPPRLPQDQPPRREVDVDRREQVRRELQTPRPEVRCLELDRPGGEGGVARPAGGDAVPGDDDPGRARGHFTSCGVSGGVHHSPLLALTAPMTWMTVATTMTRP